MDGIGLYSISKQTHWKTGTLSVIHDFGGPEKSQDALCKYTIVHSFMSILESNSQMLRNMNAFEKKCSSYCKKKCLKRIGDPKLQQFIWLVVSTPPKNLSQLG
jgi:hypothetical protein